MFVDTNVLVYTRVFDALQHLLARSILEHIRLSNEPIRISRQILREYLSTMTRPQSWPITFSLDEALDDVANMARDFEVLEDGPEVTEILLDLCRKVDVGGRQIHDANIVATMLAHGERRLMTFNVADFRRFGDLIEIVSE